jgi:hypothetical protein
MTILKGLAYKGVGEVGQKFIFSVAEGSFSFLGRKEKGAWHLFRSEVSRVLPGTTA